MQSNGAIVTVTKLNRIRNDRHTCSMLWLTHAHFHDSKILARPEKHNLFVTLDSA